MSSNRKSRSRSVRAADHLTTEAKRHISLTDVLDKLTTVMDETHRLRSTILYALRYPTHGAVTGRDLERADQVDLAVTEAVNAVARMLLVIDSNTDLFAYYDAWDTDGRPRFEREEE